MSVGVGRTSHLDFFLDYTYELIIKWHFNQLIKVEVLFLFFFYCGKIHIT